MVCVSLAEQGLEGCLSALKDVKFAEIRLDRTGLSCEDVKRLFSVRKKLIATCRPGGLGDQVRSELLVAAIESGAAYVDVEVEAEPSYRERIVMKARSRGCRVIISFHDYEKTPSRRELDGALLKCFRMGADLAKIACTVCSERDNARLLGLLDRTERVIVIGMGEKGRITRIVAPLLGSLFTFASLRPGMETAEGQIDRETLENLITAIQPRD